MSAGRPPYYNTPEELAEQIDSYFDQFHLPQEEGAEMKPNPANNEFRPTITGLCLFLGFESRQSFHDYQDKIEFSYTIKKARMRIENVYEQMLSNQSCTGSIFALKNMGWDDKQSIKHEGIPDPTFHVRIAKPEDE